MNRSYFRWSSRSSRICRKQTTIRTEVRCNFVVLDHSDCLPNFDIRLISFRFRHLAFLSVGGCGNTQLVLSFSAGRCKTWVCAEVRNSILSYYECCILQTPGFMNGVLETKKSLNDLQFSPTTTLKTVYLRFIGTRNYC